MALKISSLVVPNNVINLRLTPTILFFIGAGVSLATFGSGIPFNQNGATVAPGTSTGVPISDKAAQTALDALRQGAGLPKLKISNILKTAAALHNTDMNNAVFVGLASSKGLSPQAQVDALSPGIYTDVNMCVFVGTSGGSTTTFAQVLAAWVADPVVNSTLFDPNITDFGLSELNSNGTTFWTLIVGEFITPPPPPPVNFTGDTTTGSPVITNLSTTTGLSVGMTVTGSGIPGGSIILIISGSSITISNSATATATGVALVAQ